MPPSNFAAARNLYNRDSVLSASPEAAEALAHLLAESVGDMGEVDA